MLSKGLFQLYHVNLLIFDAVLNEFVLLLQRDIGMWLFESLEDTAKRNLSVLLFAFQRREQAFDGLACLFHLANDICLELLRLILYLGHETLHWLVLSGLGWLLLFALRHGLLLCLLLWRLLLSLGCRCLLHRHRFFWFLFPKAKETGHWLISMMHIFFLHKEVVLLRGSAFLNILVHMHLSRLGSVSTCN